MRKADLSRSLRRHYAYIVDSYKYDENVMHIMKCAEYLENILFTPLFSQDFLFDLSYFWVSEWFKTSSTHKYRISRKKKFLALTKEDVLSVFKSSKKSKAILNEYKSMCTEDEMKELNAFLFYLNSKDKQ